MRPEERQQVRDLIADNKGDKLAGVAAWLGKEAEDALKGAAKGIAKGELNYPVGWDAAFHGIIDEVERHADSDAAEADSNGNGNSGGKTSAKRKK